MDLEKVIKFAEGYGKDYVFIILSILWNPYSAYANGGPDEGSADAQLIASNGRTFSYAVISFILGTTLYSAATDGLGTLSAVSIPVIATALFLWFVLAALMHLIVRVCGSQAPYIDTVSVCLRVLPLAYVIAALLVFIISSFFEPTVFAKSTLAPLTFISVQLMVLVVYLPAGMRRVHKTNVLSQVVMMAGVVAFVGTINFFTMIHFNAPQHLAKNLPLLKPAHRPALMD